MDVLILTHGEDYEGSHIAGVFTSDAEGVALADEAIDKIKARNEEMGRESDWRRDGAFDKHADVIRAFRDGPEWLRLVSFKVNA